MKKISLIVVALLVVVAALLLAADSSQNDSLKLVSIKLVPGDPMVPCNRAALVAGGYLGRYDGRKSEFGRDDAAIIKWLETEMKDGHAVTIYPTQEKGLFVTATCAVDAR